MLIIDGFGKNIKKTENWNKGGAIKQRGTDTSKGSRSSQKGNT